MKHLTYKSLLEQLQSLPSDILEQEVFVDCNDSIYGPCLFHKFSELKTIKKDDLFNLRKNTITGQLYLS